VAARNLLAVNNENEKKHAIQREKIVATDRIGIFILKNFRELTGNLLILYRITIKVLYEM